VALQPDQALQPTGIQVTPDRHCWAEVSCWHTMRVVETCGRHKGSVRRPSPSRAGSAQEGTQARGGRQPYPALGGTCVTLGSPAERHSVVIGHCV